MLKQHNMKYENKSEDFIKRLQKERTEYSHASQVRMQAQSLLQLSQGIYTEPERFVYELLQNAVDSFTDTDNDFLDITIQVKADRFVFMHNGKPFCEKDVEGISDVGNGTKTQDSKKIGYKGIGFKSVFMPSVSRVSIISGDFCFEFNKDKAFTLMPRFPREETQLTADDIPWQVIPINSPEIREEYDLYKYNVITIVHTSEANNIGNKIEGLFKDLQFLLFLRCNNVSIKFVRDDIQEFSVGKTQDQNINSSIHTVTLLRNGEKESTWILCNEEVAVPDSVKEILKRDFNTPDKLKDAQSVVISFAVQISNGKVVPVKNASIFTFLPTSYKGLKQPFLINSNFITDAGRQHLHQESEWNRLIFRKIPELYLRFVTSFSRTYPNYIEVLPTQYPDNDSLVNVYRSALRLAFDTIAFVPNRNGNKYLMLSEVLVDCTGISNVSMSIPIFFDYINRILGVHFDGDNFVADNNIVKYAHDRIKIFETNDLEKMLLDEGVLFNISVIDDIKLVSFLYFISISLKEQSYSIYDKFQDSLMHIAFLMDEDGALKRPLDLFFPSSTQLINNEASKVSVLNSKLYNEIKTDKMIVGWLKILGIRELSNMSFVAYVFDHPEYITKENAISVGRLLFETWEKDNYLEKKEYIEEIRNINFLAKDGELRPVSTMYLGTKYKPEDDVEAVYPNDAFFISEEYPDSNNIEDWAYFLKKCGVEYKIGITKKVYKQNEVSLPFLKEAAITLSNIDHPRKGYCGFPNPIINIKFQLNYFGFIDYLRPDFFLDKYILSKVLTQDRNKWKTEDSLYGTVTWWGNRIEKTMSSIAPYSFTSKYHSFLEYIIANEQRFPTKLGTSEKAENVFINQQSIVEIGGKYLPILDIDGSVHQSWRSIISFKKDLLLSDMLLVLERVSKDDEGRLEEKRRIVSRVYHEIIDRDLQLSNELVNWAKSHKLLSTNKSGEFFFASELSFITVTGFKGDGREIYCDNVEQNNSDKLIQLLKSFGVKVRTQQDIKPYFEKPVNNNDIKERLLDKVQFIAILKNVDSTNYEQKKSDLIKKIQMSQFFKCDAISLSYGEGSDTIFTMAYSQNEFFYYTGSVSPAGIEPLLSPLCDFLGLKKSNKSELMVILLTDHDDLYDFIKEKGYDVSNINAHKESPSTPVEEPLDSVSTYKEILEIGNLDSRAQEEINKEARINAKRYLSDHGYDVSVWDPITSEPDLVDVVKDTLGNPINIVIRSARQKKIHLSASSFEILMSRPNNLLIVENDKGIRCVSFIELFGNNSNVNLIFDARYTPREYFQALGTIFRYVKGTEFVVQNPNYSTFDEIKGFGFEMKNDGTILINDNTDNI